MVSRAAGADEATAGGYEDSQGNWRIPHKLMMVEVHAGWCRVCKGLQPKLLKLIANHPEVLCCKINKTQNEVRRVSHSQGLIFARLHIKSTQTRMDMEGKNEEALLNRHEAEKRRYPLVYHSPRATNAQIVKLLCTWRCSQLRPCINKVETLYIH